MPADPERKSSERPEFVFIGEHPAIDFANTRVLDHGEPRELLSSWADVVDWLSQARLAAGRSMVLAEPAGARALKSVIELRQAWEKVLSELGAGRKVSDAFVERINELLAHDRFHEILRRDKEGKCRLIRSASELHGEKLALGLIAHEIADFLAEANWSHIRRCANTTSCVLYFYDTTKNHRRQWCSAATCGNRHKVAQFRKRLARAGK